MQETLLPQEKKILWSYSSIKLYDQCPKKYYHLRVIKDTVESSTEALLYGSRFHEAAEFYIRDGTPLPEYFKFAKDALDRLNAINGEKLCEYKMGITAALEPCAFDDKDVWWRGVVDLVVLDKLNGKAYIIDYKTGKSAKYADKDQLELMALAVFKHFPEIKKVNAGLLFVRCNALVKEKYEVEKQDEIWAKWVEEYDKLMQSYTHDVWNPRPSGLCRKHCAVLSCVHNGLSQ